MLPQLFPAGREKGSDNEANAPFGRARGSFGINFRTKSQLHRLPADLDQLTNEKIDWHRPLVDRLNSFAVATFSKTARCDHGTLVLLNLNRRKRRLAPDQLCYLCLLLLKPPRLSFGQRLNRNAEPLGGGGAIRKQGDVERRIVSQHGVQFGIMRGVRARDVEGGFHCGLGRC